MTRPSRSSIRRTGPGSHRLELGASPEEVIRLLPAGRGPVDATAQGPERQGTLVVDIRSRRAFRRQHIPGSHNIPKPLLVSSELPQEDLILVDQNGMASADLIEDLHDLGHHRLIRHLSGGLDQWEKKGFPLAQQEGAGILLKSDVLPWRPVLIAGALLLTLQHPTIGLLILSLAVAATAFRSESALHRHPMH